METASRRHPTAVMPELEEHRTETVIGGAGPAGLAVAACLRRRGRQFVLLERERSVGASWRGHYDRLHLHTDRRHSTLPFFSFPKGTPRYPSRLQVLAYLEAYAARFGVDPRFGEPVTAARRRQGWEVETPAARYRAAHLVVASGVNALPHRPGWSGLEGFRGRLIHSSEYRNGEPFRDREVLVVGLGNSGGEIAIDLFEHGARPTLAVRGPVNVIPRELLGIPILTWSIALGTLPLAVADALSAPLLRAAMGNLESLGLRRPPFGPGAQVVRRARIPLIDVGTLELVRRGAVAIRGGITRFTPGGVIFDDGREGSYDAVVLATGFRPSVAEFLEGADRVLGPEGRPLASGREAARPGLYFCGFFVSPTGMLREIAREARRIARHISRRPLARRGVA